MIVILKLTMLLYIFMFCFFPNISHPLLLSLMLIIMAVLIGGVLGVKFSSWFFFSLSLMFLGGMMVIFLYFSGLSVSEKINLKFKKLEMVCLFILLMVNLNFMCVLETGLLKVLSLNFHSLNLILNLFFIFYLLLGLFLVVKFTENFKGSLECSKF